MGAVKTFFFSFFLGGKKKQKNPEKTKTNLTLITQSFWEFRYVLPSVFPESGIFNFLICPV